MIHLTTFTVYLIILHFTFQPLRLHKKPTFPHDGDSCPKPVQALLLYEAGNNYRGGINSKSSAKTNPRLSIGKSLFLFGIH